MSPAAYLTAPIDGHGRAFRMWFRMPLYKVKALIGNVFDKRWIQLTIYYSEPSLSFVSGCIFWSWTASTCWVLLHNYVNCPQYLPLCYWALSLLSWLCSIKLEQIHLPTCDKELQCQCVFSLVWGSSWIVKLCMWSGERFENCSKEKGRVRLSVYCLEVLSILERGF